LLYHLVVFRLVFSFFDNSILYYPVIVVFRLSLSSHIEFYNIILITVTVLAADGIKHVDRLSVTQPLRRTAESVKAAG
jgi:hypothetical protein